MPKSINRVKEAIEGLIQARKEFGSEKPDYIAITTAIKLLSLFPKPLSEAEVEKVLPNYKDCICRDQFLRTCKQQGEQNCVNCAINEIISDCKKALTDFYKPSLSAVYIRFGSIPENQKSKNHLSGNMEVGVSVYEAIYRDGKYSLLLPSPTGSSCVSLSGCLDRPAYLVEGEKIGVGSDGEILLKNCKIIKAIAIHNAQEGI